jgi:hypothetical protein
VSAGRRWSPGETVVLREVWQARVWTARPATVVRDDDLLMFFVPIGARWFSPFAASDGRPLHVPTEPWIVRERTWRASHALSFAEPGLPHAVLAFWHEDWRFRAWYVNVQTALARTDLGFDYMDQELDVVIDPDLSAWRWKDEDETEVAVRLGHFTASDAARFRREAAAQIERIVRGSPPFDRDWRSWRPDPAWPIPELPTGWDRVGA